jgi:hypothetical protein
LGYEWQGHKFFFCMVVLANGYAANSFNLR